MCIKNMDFKERVMLRCTSRTERDLVDSLRYNISYILIQKGMSLGDTNEWHRIDIFQPKHFPFLTYILNRYDFDAIFVGNSVLDENSLEVMDNLVENASIRVKNLVVKNVNSPSTNRFFRKKCWNNTISIQIDHLADSAFGPEIMECPSIMNAKEVLIYGHSDEVIDISPLLEKWIENDVAIGISAALIGFEQSSADCVNRALADRKISQYRNLTHFKTNNPDKHILLELGNLENNTSYNIIIFTVTSSSSTVPSITLPY